jgi:plastocyanin
MRGSELESVHEHRTRRTHRLLGPSFGVVASLLLVSAVAGSASAASIHVRITDSHFRPRVSTAALHDSVRWTNTDEERHSVTSDQASFMHFTLRPGQQRSRIQRSAGTFPYHCRFHLSESGTLRVPVQVEPRTGATPGARLTITVAWVRIDGRTYDVQWRRDERAWTTYRTGVRARRVSFRPARVGTFSFRARVHDTIAGTVSGWSPAARSVVVHPP